MAEMTLAEDRSALIAEARQFAEELTGQRFMWPDSAGGPGMPCTGSEVVDASALHTEGGGRTVNRMVVIMVRADLLPSTRRPVANASACKYRASIGEPWETMTVRTVEVQPGGALLQMLLESDKA